jgi:hypothetical protein
MHDDLLVTDLVARAGNGEEQAWDALVELLPLIWSIWRRHRLGDADAYAVGQSIWRQLVRQMDKVQDPGALARWLAATAWRECGNVRFATGGLQIAGEIANGGRQPSHQITMAEQELLTLLIDEPSRSDTEISARLGVPVGSIGPTRSRCLEKLRRDPAIAALNQRRDGTM